MSADPEEIGAPPSGRVRRTPTIKIRLRYLRLWRMYKLIDQMELAQKCHWGIDNVRAYERAGALITERPLGILADALGITKSALLSPPPSYPRDVDDPRDPNDPDAGPELVFVND